MIYRLLRTGQVRVNKGRKKPHYKLNSGDIIRIPPVSLVEREPSQASNWDKEQLSNSILFEDKSLIILNKPAGMAADTATLATTHNALDIDLGRRLGEREIGRPEANGKIIALAPANPASNNRPHRVRRLCECFSTFDSPPPHHSHCRTTSYGCY